MNDTAESLREQIEDTKSQLSDKLQSLEDQVTETVQSIGNAVTGTVAAVQETVETVAGSVHGTVQSVSKALDVWQHLEKRPWLVLGGSVVLGCLAVESLAGAKKKPAVPQDTLPPETISPPTPELSPQPSQSVDHAAHSNGAATVEPAPPIADSVETKEALSDVGGSKASFWHELRGVAIDALITVAADAAARAVPRVLHYLASKRPKDQIMRSDDSGGSTKTGT